MSVCDCFCLQGLQYVPNEHYIAATDSYIPGTETTVFQSLINQGSLSRPLFTLHLKSFDSSIPLPRDPVPDGGIITLGGIDSDLANSGKDYSW